ncbi:MAG: SpoIVB peptidase [Firmicutes bacterium]|nr:SpoIVB peptidase [Bacillota bacterium]
MPRENRRKLFGVFLALVIIAVSFTPQFKNIVTFPQQLQFLEGQAQNLYFGFPVNVYLRSNRTGVVNLNGLPLSPQAAKVNLGVPLKVEPLQRGEAEVELLLFGVPVRRMTVNVLPPVEVIPGGHSIGVLLLSHGVIVVGEAGIGKGGSRTINPAREAGIRVGDTILKVNGRRVQGVMHLAELVHEYGQRDQTLQIEYKRKDSFLFSEIKPILCRETKRYRIGLYVRDGANGVGTLSFYHRETGRYGALGHVITDADTNQPLNVAEGSVVKAFVTGINRGSKGQPGEKVGVFKEDAHLLGDIEKNTQFGIFGTIHEQIHNPFYPQGIPIALSSQVTTGSAEIMTVLSADQIGCYEVEVERIFNQNTPSDKGMVIRVTDPQLLKETGGIIQGMSGSPIIKGGKLIGIVTHVFVNDPTRGYGVFAEWMLHELEIDALAGAGVFLLS